MARDTIATELIKASRLLCISPIVPNLHITGRAPYFEVTSPEIKRPYRKANKCRRMLKSRGLTAAACILGRDR